MSKPNPYIQELLMKFVNNRCSNEEIGVIIDYLKKTEGTNEFPDFDEVLQLFEVIPDIEQRRAQEIYNYILNSAESQNPGKPRKRILRYAAVAIIVGVLATSYLFIQNGFDAPRHDQETPAVVNIESIEPGIDKATLTLEDGTQVALERGKSFETTNASSNGEGIIYKTGEGKTKEVAFNYLTIPRGGQFNMVLSDGTKVWLNSETQLKYPVSFIEGETRSVELVYGEAYFDVSPSTEHKGTTFKVLHPSQDIEVLGTEFNVKAYKDESNIFTTLVEGKVTINNYSTIQNLTPNQQSILNTETKEVKIQLVNVDSETSWRMGVFSFEDKPLKDVMRVISRWYDVDVIFVNKELESTKFNGNLNKNRSIERILSLMLSNKLNSFKIKDKTIILK